MKNARTENAQLENDRKCTCWKMTKEHTWKMTEWNAQPGKWRKSHIPENLRK